MFPGSKSRRRRNGLVLAVLHTIGSMLARLGVPETYGKLLVALHEEEPGMEYTVRKFEIRDEKVYMSTYVGTFL